MNANTQIKMDALEAAFGHQGTIAMLSELDAMICLPQPSGWIQAITEKRNRLQDQLNEWANQSAQRRD